MEAPNCHEATRDRSRGRVHDVEDGSSGWQPQCRICLDDEGRDLIAPCKCKGSAKWVHRDCLDKWRSTKEGKAFSACTECKANYHMRVNVPPDAAWRQNKFRLLVARDLLAIFAAVQLLIVALGGLMHWLDVYDGGWFIRIMPEYFAVHERTAYYVWGLAAFLSMLGLGGCCLTLCGRGGSLDMGGCLIGGPGQIGCLDGCFLWTDCTTCTDCAAIMGAGLEGAPLLIGVAVIAMVVFAVVGVFYGIAVAAVLIQRVCQMHYHVLAKKMMTQEYIVLDLAGEEGAGEAPPLPHEHVVKLTGRGLL